LVHGWQTKLTESYALVAHADGLENAFARVAEHLV